MAGFFAWARIFSAIFAVNSLVFGASREPRGAIAVRDLFHPESRSPALAREPAHDVGSSIMQVKVGRRPKPKRGSFRRQRPDREIREIRTERRRFF
jgi:hypothetical protein